MEKYTRACKRFKKALEKLIEILENPSLLSFFREDFIVEITTKRFEYTYESMWKCVKEFLRMRGIECNSPRSCFSELLKEGLIPYSYEETLSEMIKLRNALVHIYDEENAKKIFNKIKNPLLLETFKTVSISLEKNHREIK